MKWFKSNIVMAALLAGALGTLSVGGYKVVEAVPRIRSEYFGMQVELTDIETALLENGVVVEGDDQLLGYDRFLKPNNLNRVDSDGYVSNFYVGKTYNEKLSVRNVGTIDQFVRVIVRKYWVDSTGKRVNLDPALIDVHFVTDNGWEIDEAASTPERTVLYYGDILPVGQDSSLFADKLTISSEVMRKMTGEAYDYEDVTIRLEARVEAVQTHNADDAMISVWGRKNR